MYVCVCAAVTDSEVAACLDAGADTVDEVGQRCLAGTGCGSCVEEIESLLAARRPLPQEGDGHAAALPRSA